MKTQSETALQLTAARWWLQTMIDEFEVEPADTVVNVSAVGPDGSKTLASVSLADALAKIDAAIDADNAAREV